MKVNVKRVFWATVVVALAASGLCAAAITIDGLTDELHEADVAVVLGNRVKPDGRPSPRLQGRLDRAAGLYETGLVETIIVSGGIDARGNDEGAAMKRYLVGLGIPQDRVRVDSGGFNTYLTARNVSRMIEKDRTSVIVVSQFYHISRSKMAFRRFGVSPVYGVHARYFEPRDLYATFREVVAYAVYLVRPYG